jgi:dinuclear metal center YbgI/SA1388 family protein
VIEEARELGARLIVSHHPLFFSEKSVTDATVNGGKILALAESGIAAICMHTNLDAAIGGVNDALARAAGLTGASLLEEEGRLDGEAFSYGRVGSLEEPVALEEYLAQLKAALGAEGLRYHDAGVPVRKIAVVGGSGGSYLASAVRLGCDTLVTADIKYDVFLEAAEYGVNLIDGGHFRTENLVVPIIAHHITERFPEAQVVVSSRHGDTARFYR